MTWRTNVVALAVITAAGCVDHNDIVVMARMAKPLTKYTTAIIDVEHEKPTKNPVEENGRAWIDSEIFREVAALELKPSYDQDAAGTKILCTVAHGIGIPSIGRHFSVNWIYIDRVNIKLINTETKTIIAEAEYRRRYFSGNRMDVIPALFDALQAPH